MMENSNKQSRWHIEKRIDLSMIVSVLILTVGAFIWISSVNIQFSSATVKIEAMEKDIVETRKRIGRLELRLNP